MSYFNNNFNFSGLLGATNSLFGSIFAPLLPQSSWLYNPLYHTQSYILDPEWHAIALRMAQQRFQRPDPARLEELRRLRADSASSPEEASKEKDDDEGRDLDSPEGSIEVDDDDDEPKVISEGSPERDTPGTSPTRLVTKLS